MAVKPKAASASLQLQRSCTGPYCSGFSWFDLTPESMGSFLSERIRHSDSTLHAGLVWIGHICDRDGAYDMLLLYRELTMSHTEPYSRSANETQKRARLISTRARSG